MKNILILFSCLFIFVKAQGQVNHELKNIIRFTPIGITDVGYIVGASFERKLDSNPKVGLIFPIDLVFKQFDFYSENPNKSTSYYYFSPGFKFYPSNKDKPVKYAIGSGLIFGAGKRSYQKFITPSNPDMNNWEIIIKNQTKLGFMVNNYLDFDISKQFHMGLGFSLGLLYVNQFKGDKNDIGGAVKLEANIGIKY